MATTTEEIRNKYPLPVYNYKVEIAGTTIAFTEVSGLSIGFETITYKESVTEQKAAGPRVIHMPSQPTPPTITLKKGLVRSESLKTFYAWIADIRLNQVVKKDIYIRLCDENGDPVISWQVSNAFPTKLDAPTFDANSNDAAIETMELRGDRITISEA